jgi:hypothetical protein
VVGTGARIASALGAGVLQPCSTGRKHDFKDAERLVRRVMADELILSFVPHGEQRIWRSMTRMKLQLTRDRVRLQNQIECLLEEMRIKLSIVVSNLLGASGLRILHALAKGETDPNAISSRDPSCSVNARSTSVGRLRMSFISEKLPSRNSIAAVGAPNSSMEIGLREDYRGAEIYSSWDRRRELQCICPWR